MNARLRMLVPLLAVLLVVPLMGGCSCAPQTKQTVPTPPAAVASAAPEPTATTSATLTTAPGDVTTPTKGSAARKALLDAAREKLGTSSEFYVHQLYTDGSQGIGDLESISTKNRWFVVWTGGPGYAAVWTTPIGDASKARAQAKAAVADLNPALVNHVNWYVKKAPPADAASMKASLSASAKAWTKSLMSGKGEPYKVALVKVAQDGSGSWWGRAVVQPTGDADNQYEPVEYWAKNSGGSWAGKAQDPEPPAPSTYFPSSVAAKLF